MSLLQLAGIVLLGKFLGYKELGIYTIFQIIFRLGLALFEPGMFVSIIQKQGYNRHVLKKARFIQLIILLSCVIAFLVFFILQKNYLQENLFIVIISLLLFSFIAGFSQFAAILTGQLRQRELSIAQMTGATIEFLFIIICIWNFNPLIIFTCGILLRFVIYYALCRYYYNLSRPVEDPQASVEEHISYSTYQLVNQGLSFVQGNFDTVLVGSVFGLAVLGPYNFASEISYLLFSKINPVFNKAIFPVLAKFKEDPKARQKIISESLLSHALICLPLYLLLYYNIDNILPFIAKDPEGYILLFTKFILVMAMIRSVNNIVFTQLLALGESAKLLKWNIAVTIINYVFIAVIYFLHTPLTTFLLINIFISLSVLIYTFLKLKFYLPDLSSFYKLSFSILAFIFCTTLLLYLSNQLHLHYLLNILTGVFIMLCLAALFFRNKLLQLFKFRIM